MPTTNSAKKRLRQDTARRIKNKAGRNTLKTLVKKVRSEIAAGNLDAAGAAFRTCQTELDRASVKRLIHPNAAARVKSRLSAAMVKAKSTPKAAAH